ncbi:transposon Tf2-6 polyprotein [Nephila pilipes]|uniref:Transposon Tf2-6 polyprotein n=1 Tax=Nephila pilipes TaxID=299642 RepID=A0A8X6Q501_NEPPI|nr:transposon Tf2-6 polyprotein [Nephila pilipes]
MTDQRDHQHRIMDTVSQVLRNPDVQIANQQRIRTKQILATSVCIHAPKSKCGAEREGANFQKTRFSMSLADGYKSEVKVYSTSVVIRLEGHVIRTALIALPYAKRNRTFLGRDFLQKAGIVLNLKHRNWFFRDSPYRTYDFVKEVIIQESQNQPNLEENTCLLRDDESKCLTPEQRNELDLVLLAYTIGEVP